MARTWQRTKDQFTAPAQYIQTTDTVSRPLAVMSALLMFFITIAIIVGLFFAGRWAYNEITGKNDEPANPVTGISTGASTSPSPSSSDSSANSGSGNTATVTPNNSGTATVTTNQPATSSNSSNTGSTSASSTSTSTTVPNTGTGSLLGVFVVSATVSTLAYRAVLVRKLR